MASPERARPENVPGAFFVDESCIDCDACRWIAPSTFDRAGEMARVHRQPSGPEENRRARMALLACPTGSIGTRSGNSAAEHESLWPEEIAPGVWHLGYHSRESYGAAAYLVQRPGGNVLVDVARPVRSLLRRVEELGGVRTLFLTHQDDVHGHERWAEQFGAERILHARDKRASTASVERWLEGDQPLQLAPDLRLLPVPGHTAGSTCLLVGERYLFTGDHLAWSVRLGHLYAFRSACWHDWSEQQRSMERLRAERFEWVLPGHGRRFRAEPAAMQTELERCIAWMRTNQPDD